MIKLHHHPMSTYSRKVRITLIEKGIPFERVLVDLGKGEQKKPEYVAMNPNAKVPTLVDDGFVIFESTTICEYLEDKFPLPSILPGDPQARARARMWNQYADTKVAPAFFKVFLELIFKKPGEGDMAKVEEGRKRIAEQVRILDRKLEGNDFLAGKDFTIGDIAMMPWFGTLGFVGVELDPACKHFTAWWRRLEGRKSFAESAQ